MLGGCADTCVLGKVWKVLSIHNSISANGVGFYHESVNKRNRPIVSAIDALDLPRGQSILLLVHEGIYIMKHQVNHYYQSFNCEDLT
jgi:hypothetical protein